MISTQRLALIPLSVTNLETSLVSIKQLSIDLNLPIISDLLTGRVESAVKKKLVKMRAVPEELHPWYTYFLIVIRAENIGAGLIGFKGSPDRIGSVEIGYSISPVFQGSGYMTEAVEALTDWAFSHRECLRVTAPRVVPGNISSRKVLLKAGFIETLVEADGVSYVKERD